MPLRYVPGYEASAPPARYQQGNEYGAPPRSAEGNSYGNPARNANQPPYRDDYNAGYDAQRGSPPMAGGYGSSNKTLGEHIFGVVKEIFLGTSHTIARVDLVRPHRRRAGPSFSNQQEAEADQTAKSTWQSWNGPAPYHGGPGGPSAGGNLPGAYYGQQYGPSAPPAGNGSASQNPSSRQGWISNLHDFSGISGRGARLKLMQVWNFPDEEGNPRLPYEANIAVGANYDVERSELQPKCRIRMKNAAIHLLPRAELELRGKYNVGISRMAVDIRYRVPVASAYRFWDGESGARLLINLFHPFGTGIHLSPGGIEFDERVWQLSKHTYLRAAATLDFPRKIPFEGERFRFNMHRLGLKTRLT